LLAVILAAGSGTRLRPLTDVTPKCLLEIARRPLLDRLLAALAEAGLGRAVIVIGHLSTRIEEHFATARPPLDVMLVRNSAYATTNNAASLAVARREIGADDFILCDGDVMVSVNPFPALIAAHAQCALAVDTSAPFDNEAMKVELAPDGHVTRISKQLSAAVSAGESIGLQKIGGGAAPILWDVLGPLVARDPARAYYEDAFQQMIDRGVRFETTPVASGQWAEIDDMDDLEEARRLFAERR
jgi:choline kinase